MTKQFSTFIATPTKANFSTIQNSIISDDNYSPYSDDIYIIMDLYEDEKLEELINYEGVNIKLSSKVHYYKHLALLELGRIKEAINEKEIAIAIVKGILSTGNGSISSPYIITRVSDERDVLDYLDENLDSQSLIFEKSNHLDLIGCQSGKEIYFNINYPFLKMSKDRVKL